MFCPYDQWTSYGQSKSANVLMPGNVASTALARHVGADDLANFGETTALALPPGENDRARRRCLGRP